MQSVDNLFILAHLLSSFTTWSMYEVEGKKQSVPGNHKGNTREQPICLHMLWANCIPGEKGDTWNMKHRPHHLPHIQNRVQSGQKTATPRQEDLTLLPLYIDYRHLPQCNMHWWPPQLSMEVIYRNFCDPTLTSFLQSKEYMQLKVKRAVVPTTKLPHWAVQGKTEENLHGLCSATALHSWTAPDEPFYTMFENCTKIFCWEVTKTGWQWQSATSTV